MAGGVFHFRSLHCALDVSAAGRRFPRQGCKGVFCITAPFSVERGRTENRRLLANERRYIRRSNSPLSDDDETASYLVPWFPSIFGLVKFADHIADRLAGYRTLAEVRLSVLLDGSSVESSMRLGVLSKPVSQFLAADLARSWGDGARWPRTVRRWR